MTGAMPGRRGFLSRLMALPNALLSTAFSVVHTILRTGVNTAVSTIRALLPAPLFRRLRSAVESVTGPTRDVGAEEQAQTFIALFRSLYGDLAPTFLPTSFESAARRAQRNMQFLFVYLHSPEHEDTDAFCRTVLCDEELLGHLATTDSLAWGGSIHSPEAFHLSKQLRVGGFPFCALLVHAAGRLNMAARVNGAVGAGELVAALRQAEEVWGPQLVAARADREEQAASRSLIAEQDEAFQQSLLEDQAKEESRQVEQAAARAAEAAASEEAAAQLSRADAEAARLQQIETDKEERRRLKRQLLRLEPAEGPDTTLVRVRMANGSNAQRRFLATDTVQAVYDFVDSLEELTSWQYHLVTHFPRKDYGPETLQQTLRESGLAPKALLMVQNDDD